MGLKKLVLCLLLPMLLAHVANATQYAFQVTFSGKKGTADITAPLTFLSQRALDRRATYGIAVDSADLPVSPVYIDSVLQLTGGKLHVTSRWLNSCVILLNDSSQIHQLQNRSFVTGTQLVAVYAGSLHRSSKTQLSPSGARTTGSASYYGTTYTQTIYVNGDYLHDRGYKGAGKLIAILDAGFIAVDTNPGFDSLRQSGRILDTHNFVLANNDVYNYDDHGTMALSTMAGNQPSTYVGSAPDASYAIYISEDDNSEQPIEMYNMVAATERADSLGADIISESLGYNIFFDFHSADLHYATDLDGHTTPVAKAANFATAKGMLFVASAGNEGPSEAGWGNYILTPADADSSLAVGATNISKFPSVFTSYGPNAAGVIKPDVCTLGESVYVLLGNVVSAQDGTSFSTPQIAGWAACLWQAAGAVKPYAIRSAIDRSADHYNNPGNQLGYGIPDFSVAMRSLHVGDTPNPVGNADKWLEATPNPFTEKVTIHLGLSSSQPVAFDVIDVTGRSILTKEWNYQVGTATSISLPATLPAGIYFLKATASGQQQTIKLEKN